MEHMYVHSIVCENVLVCWLPYFGCIQDLELDYVQSSCCRSFSATKILPNPKLKKKIKEKFLCRIFGINCGT